ncbi:MAG: CPBP family intramembrane glutamic endopeptidase [Planctomycetaceae bacterium]
MIQHGEPVEGGPKVPSSPVVVPEGPGLLEAYGWVMGYQIAQLIVLTSFTTLLVWLALPQFPPTVDELVTLFDDLGWEQSFLFMGVTSLATLGLIVPAVCWRLKGDVRKSLGMQRVRGSQLLFIVAAVVPLAILSDELYRVARDGVVWLAQVFPVLNPLVQLDTVQLVQRQAANTSFPILIVALALGPAIGEELVFRGLIGQGLIRRRGLISGVLLTTLLFGFAHGNPAHAIATLPIGLMLHYVYVLTGNLWCSILLHFLINGVAVALMKLVVADPLPGSPALLVAAAVFLGVLCLLLWQSERKGSRLSWLEWRQGTPFRAVASCGIVAYTVCILWAASTAWGR